MNTIYNAINQVRKDVSYIQKDTSVRAGSSSYSAVTHDMVIAKCRDAMIQQGLFILPSVVESKTMHVRDTAKGSPIYRYEASYLITVIADGVSDSIAFTFDAHGEDMGDKAPAKALSMVYKYAHLKLFSLETGENEESRVEGDRNAKNVLAHLSEELNEYIEHNDALAVYLMARNVGDDIWADLYNSAPSGKKTSFKKQLANMEKVGLEVLQAINTAIDTQDKLGAVENIEDLTEGGKRLLANHLGKKRAVELGELIK